MNRFQERRARLNALKKSLRTLTHREKLKDVELFYELKEISKNVFELSEDRITRDMSGRANHSKSVLGIVELTGNELLLKSKFGMPSFIPNATRAMVEFEGKLLSKRSRGSAKRKLENALNGEENQESKPKPESNQESNTAQ